MCKLIGAGVELRVAHLLGGEDQCRSVRCRTHLGFDQIVQALLAGEVCGCGVPLAQHMLLLVVTQQRQFAKRRLRVMRQRLQDLLEMRRQLRHLLLAEVLTGVTEAQRQGFTEIDHQRQWVMRLLLRMQTAEHQPRRRSLLQGFGHRVVFEHQNSVEQRLASAACPTLNLVQRRVFVLSQGDVLRLHLLHPLRHALLCTWAGDHRQSIDEQPELLLDTRQVRRTPGHGCAKGDAGLPRVALQHQQPGRLHQCVEGHALLAGKLTQLTGVLGVDQVQVITVPLAVLRRLEGLHQARGLIESGQLTGPETLAEPGILALQPFDVVAIAADLPRQCLAAITLQHFT
ncbi:putative non-ribosomal peptide synthetase [Pseudomonas syringae pv. syringae]|nr:putative non-ribosomal peptide synthetase [Pseudomonas syringae pv. syringae]